MKRVQSEGGRKDERVTLNKLFPDIFTQNLMMKNLSPTGASSIYKLPTQKRYKFIFKNWL